MGREVELADFLTNKILHMKLAKTNHEEIDRLYNALNEVEWLHKELKNADFEDVDFYEFEIMSKFDKSSAESFLKDLVNHLSSIHFQRIIWNCRTLFDNCSNPALSHLDFNADIKAGLELLEKQRAKLSNAG